ncbi:MAG: sodium:calcium antiporter [Actinomycetota bacterium]|nr:sodium:calcium antiporter [Actinomycetota bacterium]
MDWAILIGSLFVILVGAELFTNGVEWVGEGFGLSEGAVGSVLAAVGTALPETLLPLVAIFSGHATGDEIGTGAILGAPFMLTTLAMVVIAVTVLVASRHDRRPRDLEIDHGVIRQDLGYFLVMYSLALVAGFVHVRTLHVGLAIVLVVGYGYYVRRHFISPGEDELAAQAGGEIKPLELWQLAKRFKRGMPDWSTDRSSSVPFVQVALALGVIVGGADLFVHSVGSIGTKFGVPPLAFSLLVAPLATELPEKFNSVIWVRRRKDTLAMGNMTGAMVFQASFPVTVGLLFTDWKLEGTGAVAAGVALVAGGVLWATLRFRGRLSAPLLLFQGVFYVGYVAFVLTRI